MTSTEILYTKSKEEEYSKTSDFSIDINLKKSLNSIKDISSDKSSYSITTSVPSILLHIKNNRNNNEIENKLKVTELDKAKSSESLNHPYPLIKLNSSLLSTSNSSSTVKPSERNVLSMSESLKLKGASAIKLFKMKKDSKRNKKGFNFKRQKNIKDNDDDDDNDDDNDNDNFCNNENRSSISSLHGQSLTPPRGEHNSKSLSILTHTMSRKSSCNSVRYVL